MKTLSLGSLCVATVALLVLLLATCTANAAASAGVKIYHLSDFHFDPLQNTTRCSVGPCNGRTDVPPSGMPGCDSGWLNVVGSVRAVARAIAADTATSSVAVIVTGDFDRHKLWDNCTGSAPLDMATDIISRISEMMQRELSLSVEQHQQRLFRATGLHAHTRKKSIALHFSPGFGAPSQSPSGAVSVVQGNNDHATNDYFMNISSSSHPLLDVWSQKLTQHKILDNATATQFRQCGFFGKQLVPGLRVVTLNTLVWSVSLQPPLTDAQKQDPCGQFAFLAAELADARNKNQKVVIMSHIGPIPFALWQQQYVDRFKAALADKVIVAGFFGHIHRFSFGAMSSAAGFPPLFAGGPITRVSHTNPDVTVYELDAVSFAVTDVRQIFLRPDAVKQRLDPRDEGSWKMSPSFKDAMGLSSLGADQLYALGHKMRFDNDAATNALFLKYWSFVQGMGGDVASTAKCDELCRIEHTCAAIAFDIVSAGLCVV